MIGGDCSSKELEGVKGGLWGKSLGKRIGPEHFGILNFL